MLHKQVHQKSPLLFHLQLIKTLLLVANTTGFIIYALAHLVFFDFPFVPEEEAMVLLKMFGVASLFAVAISIIFVLADTTDLILKKRVGIAWALTAKTASIAILALVLLLASCKNGAVKVGVKKDFNTGLSSAYSGIEPEKTFLVMNNEIINHTDIPLGESFLLVNDGIKGLQSKNGKVKVGCSLSITDKKGSVLLSEKDLFAGHDEFEEKDAKMLKCTVNTGEPMKWEENYMVAVTFWDKNGNGKIENNVTIRSIDIP